jgi:hypothetical protein
VATTAAVAEAEMDMKRPLQSCPRFKESFLYDANGRPVVKCAICAFGKSRGASCTFAEVVARDARRAQRRPY